MAGVVDRAARDGMLRNIQQLRAFIEEWNHITEDEFMAPCGHWVRCRRETIEVFGEMRNELNAISSKAETAKIVGSVVSVAGAVTTFFFPPVGMGMMAVGGGVSGCATVAEIYLNKSILERVQAALRTDEMYTRMFIPWFQRSQNLQTLFRKVFDLDASPDSSQDLLDLFEAANVIVERGGETLARVVEALSRGWDRLFDRGLDLAHIEGVLRRTSDTVRRLLLAFCTDQKVREAVKTIISAIRSAGRVLLPILSSLLIGLAGTAQLLPAVVQLLPTHAQVMFNNLNGPFLGAALALPLAMSTFSAVSVANLAVGTSRYDRNLRDAQRCLESELNCFLREFPALA